MTILMFVADDFCIEDVYEAFQSFGGIVKICRCTKDIMLETNSEYIKNSIIKEKADLIFTFNYYPAIAIICNEMLLRYVSWVYDNPYVNIFSYTALFSTNTIYVFERDIAEFFQLQGVFTIQYLPLAANPARLIKSIQEKMAKDTIYSKIKDISFVGSMYNEKHQFYTRMINKGISKYTEGYLRGIISAQKKIYGSDIITPLLNADIISDMKKALPLAPDKGNAATTEFLFAKYVIDRQITAEERMELLSMLGKKYDVHIFTINPDMIIPNCTNHGPAHSDFEAPLVYNTSKININISLRSIVNGIPLRAFEIMGSGGFLLTNYQAEFLDYFVPGEDFDYYDSPEDMLSKIDYYLNHDSIRKQIANNGYNKVKELHTFRNRIKEMGLF